MEYRKTSEDHFADRNNTQTKIIVEYFWQKTCRDCKRVEPIINQIKNELPFVEIKRLDCKSQDNINLFREKCIEYNVPIELRMNTPTLFIGNKYLINDNITFDKLKKTILLKQKE